MKYEITFLQLFLYILTINAEQIRSTKKRVCVIGAGVSGINSLKQLAMKGDEFEPIVFDKNSDVGGLWIYRQNTDFDEHGLPSFSPMYKNLRTNIPKELMAFPDYQEFHGENRSYVTHETVAEYMRNYTDHFNLRRYIKFDTLVKKVRPITGKDDGHSTKWHVETLNLNANKTKTTICDAVIVCNGHFNEPYIPEIANIDRFKGRVLHSIKYREPEEFANQTVVLLGGSWSSMDIGIEVSHHAKKVYLSHRHQRIDRGLPANLTQVANVVEANGSELILSDGSRIAADALILCTGYLYDYPFLDESSGISVTHGKYVHPLYKHLVNVEYPTMAFINIPYPASPFTLPHAQSLYFIAILQGKIKLPSRVEMLKESTLPVGTSISKAHYVFEDVWSYYANLSEGLHVTAMSTWHGIAYDAWLQQIFHDVANFKEKDLRVDGHGHVEFVWRNK